MPRAKIDRKDWRGLPYEHWNTATIHAYFIDRTRELYGIEYAPMRNWKFEQALVKRALTDHGAEMLHRAFDECFRVYQPNPQFPILTAGFAIAYRLNAVIPALKKADAIMATVARPERMTADELRDWF
ncbi:hypothetical protein [Paenibacillus sp. P22]|uniref:hypothetical protein n=1 Tax=Paenibacillus sp. P22 TaxID=483908 RepID=UPI00038FA3AE|nr:hypothetical protein [Paenibacillus sp. P22]CDN42022.1 Uncharacterized protein BN871_AT_00240 [Paenibacillus sp. P22]